MCHNLQHPQVHRRHVHHLHLLVFLPVGMHGHVPTHAHHHTTQTHAHHLKKGLTGHHRPPQIRLRLQTAIKRSRTGCRRLQTLQTVVGSMPLRFMFPTKRIRQRKRPNEGKGGKYLVVISVFTYLLSPLS
jgi:hypothetical protein